MLTEDETDYLSKIPEDKKVVIKPYNSKTDEIAEGYISRVNKIYPDLKIIHMGASSFGISGQGDVDIYALTDQKDFDNYISGIVTIFGEPTKHNIDSIVWTFNVDEIPVEFYLTDPNSPTMKRQIAVFDRLKSDQNILDEYEKLKEDMNGKSFREYQKKKYEFYHRLLDQKSSNIVPRP